ncbi:hypothetical protein [Acidovorax cavernicola]|uniref:Uncharacterized protein n=1 Tax=Acidovorax cavernicola TaxID=1675792 RepID=A0A9X8D8Y7_9BURK|nr:hypothetical protein [Acidovorax cavernicola]RIX84825.1 hypothetical protein D3H34_04175 [Acidovorax cavernicola]
MDHALPFIVVEDRQNTALRLCCESAAMAAEHLVVLSDTDAGPAYERFCQAYVHLSSNTPAFEKICFRRYFLLANHLAAHPECRAFVLIDSDVLLFRGVGAHIARLAGGADFCGSSILPAHGWDPCQISPHVSYWTAAGLRDFVACIARMYSTPAGLHQLRDIAERFAARSVRGGVSDMTLLCLWAQATGNTLPINRVLDGQVIDHNVNGGTNHLAREFRVRGGAKRLSFVEGLPCLQTPAGETVRVLALHFQGAAKMAMQPALQRRVYTVAALTWALQMARRAKNNAHRIASRARRMADTLGFAQAPAAKHPADGSTP